MRIFKRSTSFRCSEESPVVLVWVSLPYLPLHFIHCKPALFSITAAIGTPLRVDHATASVNRSSVARVSVEYDVSRPLLSRIWIGEGETEFLQDVVFERVPTYCRSCKHLGHSADTCYVSNPGLHKPQQPVSEPHTKVINDKRKMPVSTQEVQPGAPTTAQYVVVDNKRPQGSKIQTIVSSDQNNLAHTVPLPTLQDIGMVADRIPCPPVTDCGGPSEGQRACEVPIDDHLQVGFNSHCTDIPDFDETVMAA